MSHRVATGLLALMLLSGAALPVVPCLRDGAAGGAIWVVYAAAGAICHQRPERSLTSCGRQWPVCGRCSGLYLGAAAGVVLSAASRLRRGTWRQWRGRVAAAAVPTAVLWASEMAGLGDPGTPARLIVALPAGVATALWLSAVARGDLR